MKNEQMNRPTVIVGTLIYDDDGKLLLGKTHKWKGKWVVFGGKIDFGESCDDCVRREVKEETGLEVTDIEFLTVQESILPEGFYKKIHFIMLDYLCKATSHDVTLNDEMQEYGWFTPAEALDLNLNETTRIFIENYMKKRENKE